MKIVLSLLPSPLGQGLRSGFVINMLRIVGSKGYELFGEIALKSGRFYLSFLNIFITPAATTNVRCYYIYLLFVYSWRFKFKHLFEKSINRKEIVVASFASEASTEKSELL